MRSYCHSQENKFLQLLYDNLREREKERNTCLKILEKTSRERNHSSPIINKKKRTRETRKFFTLRNASKIEGFFFSFFSNSSFLCFSLQLQKSPKNGNESNLFPLIRRKRGPDLFVFFFSICFISWTLQ